MRFLVIKSIAHERSISIVGILGILFFGGESRKHHSDQLRLMFKWLIEFAAVGKLQPFGICANRILHANDSSDAASSLLHHVHHDGVRLCR